jgi:hypothetical protein
MMMAINQDYVKLENIPNNQNFAERAIKFGIFGRNPKIEASKEKGEKVLNEIVDRLTKTIFKVKETNSIDPFDEIYRNYNKLKGKQFNFLKNRKGIYENQGIENTKVALKFFKWWIFKNKKHNPDFKFSKNDD